MNFSQPIRTRLLSVFFLILGLIWIGVSRVPLGTQLSESIAAPQTGFKAPDFSLNDMDGNSFRLSDLRGKVVLVNIWASWCPPCRAEMPAINRVYQQYKDQGFVVLAVDSAIQDTLANAKIFATENKLSFPILLDQQGLVTRLYQVQSLPSSFFINADGTIDEVVIGGPMAEALLVSRVEKLLREVP